VKQEKREIQQINKDEGIVELDDDEKDKLIDLDSFTAVPLPTDIIHYAVQLLSRRFRASCLHSCMFVLLPRRLAPLSSSSHLQAKHLLRFSTVGAGRTCTPRATLSLLADAGGAW